MRLFVAIDPPPHARAHLAAVTEPLRDDAGALRWAAPQRWHLTLAFLGEVDPARVNSLARGLEGAAGDHPSMELAMVGAGRFGTVLWVGIAGETDRLASLAADVSAVTAAALGDERPAQRGTVAAYRPHLTLARSRPGAGRVLVPPALHGYAGPPWPVDRIRLVRSDLGSRPRHTAVGTWRLRPRPLAHPTSSTQESP